MNSCILMAEIVQEPTLRSTPDTQTPMTDMIVEFPGLRPDDPASRLRIVGWGNLAQEMQERYHKGDRVVIEGRLSMTTVELEGYKEKRAELIAQRIHRLEANALWESTPTGATVSSAENQFSTPKRAEAPASARSTTPSVKSPATKFSAAKADSLSEPNLDDIPF